MRLTYTHLRQDQCVVTGSACSKLALGACAWIKGGARSLAAVGVATMVSGGEAMLARRDADPPAGQSARHGHARRP